MTRRDEILEVICDYAKDHKGNSPSQNDLLQEMHKNGYTMSKGTLQVHLNKLLVERRLYTLDGHLIVTGSRWRYVDQNGVVQETLADMAVCDPLSFTATAASSRRRIHRLRKRGASHVRSGDLEQILRLQKGFCWWCGVALGSDYHIDHRIPLARGGTNELGNLCASCPKCNMEKHDKMPWEFNGRLV